MKPAFAWPGGKSWAIKYILPKIPSHTLYCEPFGGGLAILLAKELSEVEVVNDINSDLVTFYRCVRFHLDELIKEVQWVLNSREEFNDLRKQSGLTDIQRAARWFRIQTLSFGGDGDSYGVGRKTGGGVCKSRVSLIERIDQLNTRLDRVNIEHLDWERCLSLYDSDETFFFVDPPYQGGKIKNYKAWLVEDIIKLRDTLTSLRAQWLLTLNDSKEVRDIFSGYTLKPLKRFRGVNNKEGARKEYAELLISRR